MLELSHAQCYTYITGHEILTAGVATVSAEGGSGEIKAELYDVGGCKTYNEPNLNSGDALATNYTILSLDEPFDGGDCLVKDVGGERVYDSFQAIVLQTNGYEKWTTLSPFRPTVLGIQLLTWMSFPNADF